MDKEKEQKDKQWSKNIVGAVLLVVETGLPEENDWPAASP